MCSFEHGSGGPMVAWTLLHNTTFTKIFSLIAHNRKLDELFNDELTGVMNNSTYTNVRGSACECDTQYFHVDRLGDMDIHAAFTRPVQIGPVSYPTQE
jgi:hypothetical protein